MGENVWIFGSILLFLTINMTDCSSKQLINDAYKAIKNNSAIGYKLDDRSDDFEMYSDSKYDSRSEEGLEDTIKEEDDILGINHMTLKIDSTTSGTLLYNWVTYEKNKRGRLAYSNNLVQESITALNQDTYIMSKDDFLWPWKTSLLTVIIGSISAALVFSLTLSIIIIYMIVRKTERVDRFDQKLKDFFQVLVLSVPKNFLKILSAKVEYC